MWLLSSHSVLDNESRVRGGINSQFYLWSTPSIFFLHSQKERKTSNLEDLGKIGGRKGRGRWSVVLKFQYFLYTVNSIGQNELSIPEILIGHKHGKRAVHESPIRGHALYIYIVDFEFLKNWKLFPIKIFLKAYSKLKSER